MLVYQWLSANDTVGLAVGSCRIPKKRTVQTDCSFSLPFCCSLSSQATSLQVGRRHCGVERVLWTMQRNVATQAHGRCAKLSINPYILAHSVAHQKAPPRAGDSSRARPRRLSEATRYPAATYLPTLSHEKLFHNLIQLRRYFSEAAIQVKRFCAY